MNQRKWKLSAVASGLLTLTTGMAHAAVVASDLSGAQTGAGSLYASTSPQEYAQEFVTGAQMSLSRRRPP